MWSTNEKRIARRAFALAQEREASEIIGRIKEMADQARNFEDLWEIHDLLTNRREDFGQKYDYRYSVLISVFARLLSEGWIGLDDLEGLDDDKIEQIKMMVSLE